MTALELAQPFWRVKAGGAPGLTAEERAALDRDLAPDGFMADARKTTRQLGLGLLAVGALGALVAMAAGLRVAYQLLTNATRTDAATLLVFASVLCVVALALGGGIFRSSSRGPRALPLHRRDGVLTSKRGAGPTRSQGTGPIEYRVVLDGSLELRVQLHGRDLWSALEEGASYRVWFTPHPGAFVIYAEPVPST